MSVHFETFGDATLYLGDMVEVLHSFPAASFDLLFADPPYGNDNHNGDLNSRTNKNRQLVSTPILNDDYASTRRLLEALLCYGAHAMKRDSAIAVMTAGGGPTPLFAWLINDAFPRWEFEFDHTVIWNKLDHGLGKRYRRGYEMIHVAHPARGKLPWHRSGAIRNIIDLCPPKQREHPNEKPVAVPLYFILNHAPVGGVVLDPYVGSGSTGVAALRAGRRFIGIERDERWFELACRNLTREVERPKGDWDVPASQLTLAAL